MRRLGPVLALVAGVLAAGTVSRRFAFRLEDLRLAGTGSGTVVEIAGGRLPDRPGEPALPEVPVALALPPGARVTGVSVRGRDTVEVPGKFRVAPVQAQRVLSDRSPGQPTEPDPAVYLSTGPFPDECAGSASTGTIRGVGVADLVLRPLVYLPDRGRLLLVRSIDVSVEYASRDAGARTDRFAAELARGLVDNPERVGPGYDPDDPDRFEYLVVTSPELESVFARLAAWKTARGVPAVVRTMEQVRANHGGGDDAEKLRNYLKRAAEDSGLAWVLLGGDTDVVPMRKAFAMVCSAGLHPREDSLPADLYYSDLDGTWDWNHNGVFGEVADLVDLYPDVFVGRAPVNTVDEARVFVDKVLTYERPLVDDFLTRALLAAQVLWQDPYTDEGVSKDLIEEQCLPAALRPAVKLYESRGGATVDSARQLLSRGNGVFNHCGHGWTDAMGVGGSEYLHNEDIDALANAGRCGIGYSIGCWTTAFDFDAIAERFVVNPGGGGVAFIGNSSYGWGAPGNPTFGYSDRFDRQFFAELSADAEPRLGRVVGRAKARFIPHSREPNCYRWHQYCLNLLGDPEMPVHTDRLLDLDVELPTRIGTGHDITHIAVTGPRGPVEGAVACLSRPGDCYLVERTGPDGTARFETDLDDPGEVRLVVSAPGYRPGDFAIDVTAAPHVGFAGFDIVETTTGEAVPRLMPGSTYSFRFRLVNTGDAAVGGLVARLRGGSDALVFEDSLSFVGTIGPGDTTERRIFRVRVAADAAPGAVVQCRLRLADDIGAWWDDPFGLTVGGCRPEVAGWDARDAGDDSMPEPGDTVALDIAVGNRGPDTLPPATVSVFRVDENVVPVVPGTMAPPVAPGETAWCRTRPLLELAPSCPVPYVARVGIKIFGGGELLIDTVEFVVGRSGLWDDFEAGAEGWTHGGQNDNWHLSARSALSGESAFYAGFPGGGYPDSTDAWLLSPGFIMPRDATLRLWRRFGVPIYGVDGLYVILETGAGHDTLDFIGSGGALGPGGVDRPGLESGWLAEEYDLSGHAPGESCRVRFAFVSDGDGATGDGCYVDDVRVAGTAVNPGYTGYPEADGFVAAFPNPTRDRTTIIYVVRERIIGFPDPPTNRLRAAVFDRAGRLVRTLRVQDTRPGWHAATWEGDDDRGTPAPPGVYFVRMMSSDAGAQPSGMRMKLVLAR